MDQMEENEIELGTVVVEIDGDNPAESATDIPVTPSVNLEETNKIEKLVKFPTTRIKHLVKMDPDVNLCSQEAVFLITKATVSIFAM